MTPVVTLIFEIVVIVLMARAFGLLFRLIHQPHVIGEMVAGVLLGPSLLGWVAPNVYAFLFPSSSLTYLNTFSMVGILIYMFLVGMGVNYNHLNNHKHAAILISHVSIVVPFLLGAFLALLFYTKLSDDSVSFASFALFMAAAMSVTAFPVLARILTDRHMLATRLGTLSIACAAVDDITGWCVLALIVVLLRAHAGSIPVWVTAGGTVLFTLVMVYGARPLARYFYTAYARRNQLGDGVTAMLLTFVLVSALVTEQLGIHLLFGAFLAGMIMPKEPQFVRHIAEKFESITIVLLLPLFFAFTGLRVNLHSFTGGALWLTCIAIILVAVAGKLGGSMIAARAAGLPWKDAAGIGILMNTRGLMELVILNIGLDVGVISPVLFSMMVLMALVTTFMTAPLLEWLYPLRVMQTEVSMSLSSPQGRVAGASTTVASISSD